jgi:DNA-binding SARP family transcriptional activator
VHVFESTPQLGWQVREAIPLEPATSGVGTFTPESAPAMPAWVLRPHPPFVPMTLTGDHETNTVAERADRQREDEWPATSRAGRRRSRLGRDNMSQADVPDLRVRLLGGFSVEGVDTGRLGCDWPRRSAKTLTKLLATCPGHSLHREQIIDILWPGVDLDSALNSFGKALHAARHAIEPGLPPRGRSCYLRLTDGMLSLDTQYVEIDADRFEELAKDALRQREIEPYEAALGIYAGELLPEDRYEDWCAERRGALAELRVRLLVGMANALEQRGAYIESADRLRQVVREDPTREEIHRRLIRLWAEIGNPDQAVRQFQACREALRRDLDLLPQRETVSLYEDVLANRIPARAQRGEREKVVSPRPSVRAPARATPFVGRQQVLECVLALLDQNDQRAPMLLLTGEAGIGKTRLLEALAGEASRAGTVLRGEVGAHISHLPYGPVAVALDGFVALQSESDRRELARSYPTLARIVPSLALDTPPSQEGARADHLDFLLAIVRALGDLAGGRPLLFVVDDLHQADRVSLDVLRYFAHLARSRGWLLVATVREEELQANAGVARALESMLREGLCAKLELPALSRAECDQMVCALTGGEPVDDAIADQIHARSGGNPLFIEALVADAEERQSPRPANGCLSLSCQPESRVSPHIRSVVISQLRPLDDTVRRILDLVAIAETAAISLDRLLAAAAALELPLGPATVFDALDQALALRVLEERDDGYAFRHPLVRSALYQALSKHRREELKAALRRPDGPRARRLRATASR